jgi:hypothetical protein
MPQFSYLPLVFQQRSKPGISLFKFECITLRVDIVYAEAVEGVKSRATLSAGSSELISILKSKGKKKVKISP